MMRYWTAFYTILVKETMRFIRIWPQTVLPAVVTTTLYFTIFGKLMGERIGDMAHMSYIEFIAPGMILMTVITNSYANVVSSFYSGKFQRHVEELLVSPVPDWVILAGYVGGGVARGLSVGVAVSIVSAFFVDFEVYSFSLGLLVFVMTSAVFATAGFINAVFANSFDDISIVPIFVLTPLTYLGGVFYSIDLLPAFWRQVSLFNPILYMVNAFRYGIYGVSDINILWAFFIMAGFLALLLGAALYLLRKGIGIKS